MGRIFWSLIFLTIPIFGVGLFLAAPAMDLWLPRNVSPEGAEIDSLFYIILWITGGVFVLTQLLLVYYLFRYEAVHCKLPVRYTHGIFKLEVGWTLVTGVVLVFLAFYSQFEVWDKLYAEQPKDPGVEVEVLGRQFEWRLRYPGADGQLGTADDIFHVNDLHVPVGEPVLVWLKAEDVLHSFYLPNFRVKQDLVPGMKIPIWFTPSEVGQFDLYCTELCGWGHYTMTGRLTVETDEQFAEWLATRTAQQNQEQ
jgi:cytochrome c oxidase subunit 2